MSTNIDSAVQSNSYDSTVNNESDNPAVQQQSQKQFSINGQDVSEEQFNQQVGQGFGNGGDTQNTQGVDVQSLLSGTGFNPGSFFG
jgi:hypothetical protein